MSVITIISENITSRLEFICKVIFEDYLGTSYKLVSTASQDDQTTIHYGYSEKNSSALQIPSLGLLKEDTVRVHDVGFGNHEGLPFLYGVEKPDDYVLPFDLFSMCFFLLTRYEEYHQSPRDQYDRYQSKHSTAVKYNFIGLPLVDLWVKKFAIILTERFEGSFKLTGSFDSEVTIDIDLPYAFKAKGLKSFGGIIRDVVKLDVLTAKHRIKYWLANDDPFDTYSWIATFCSENNIKPKFFILNRYQLPNDENHLANKIELRNILHKIMPYAEIGIHPSLSAQNDPQSIREELSFVTESIKCKISNSRQHFLQLTLPETYRALISCDIEHDFSMGYPDLMGFRASTSRPFRFYDLLNEKETRLMIHPCIAMDVTMKNYLNLTSSDAIKKCEEIAEKIRQVNGTFSFIWHNSSLSSAYGWKGWREVFIRLAQL